MASGPVYTQSIAASRQGIDVTKRIAQEMPDESLFAVLLMRARKRVATHWDIKWFDDRPAGWWTQINNGAGYDDKATDMVVDDETIFAPKDLIKVARTGEQLLVTEIKANHTIAVTRGYGVTAAVAINDNDWLMLLANGMEENSSAPTSKVAQPTESENYAQTIRTPFDESDLSAVSDVLTNESERKRLRRIKMLDHRLSIERTAIWGEKKKDTTNRRYLTGGVLSFISSNVYDASGDLTEARFDEFCEMGFKYGHNNKVLVCSPSVGAKINAFAKAKIETSTGDTTYGLKLNYIQTFHGKVYLVNSRTFEHDYSAWGVLLDMPNVWYRPLQGRDTKLFPDIQANDQDGWKDEYRTKFAMQVELEKTHAVLKNAVTL